VDLNGIWELRLALRGRLWVQEVDDQITILDANHVDSDGVGVCVTVEYARAEIMWGVEEKCKRNPPNKTDRQTLDVTRSQSPHNRKGNSTRD
jgi:hypothetical protein